MSYLPEPLLEVLRSRIAEALKAKGPRRLSGRALDAAMGRPESGWTSKFLRRQNEGVTLEGLLAACTALGTHPGDLMEEAYPRPLTKAERECLSFNEEEIRRIAREELEARLRKI